MSKYSHIKMFLMLLFLAVICFSLSSCMIFFMGDFREFLIDENFNDGIANNWMPLSGNWYESDGEYWLNDSFMAFDYTNSYYFEPVLENNDHFSYQVTVKQIAGDSAADNQCGLIFRSEDPGSVDVDPLVAYNGYLLRIQVYDPGSYWALEKYVDGVLTTLGSGNDNANINDVLSDHNEIRVKCEGSVMEVYINGHFIGSADDGTHMGRYVGLYAHTSASDLNWFAFDNVQLWIPREYQD